MSRFVGTLRRQDRAPFRWIDLPSGLGIVVVDASKGFRFRLRLTTNVTLHIINGSSGQEILLRVVQDGTGGRTLTTSGGWTTAGSWVLSSTANAVSFLEAVYEDVSGLWERRGSHADSANTKRVMTWSVANPSVGQWLGQVRIPVACTATRVHSNTKAGTATFNLEERSTLLAAGTNILSSDQVADTNGEDVTSSFNNSSLAAGNWIYPDISAVSGCTGLTIQLEVEV